jgi:hypothetical protein
MGGSGSDVNARRVNWPRDILDSMSWPGVAACRSAKAVSMALSIDGDVVGLACPPRTVRWTVGSEKAWVDQGAASSVARETAARRRRPRVRGRSGNAFGLTMPTVR